MKAGLHAHPEARRARRREPESPTEPARVLSEAVVRASALLGLRQGDLARVLGVSAPTVSRLANGAYLLEPGRKEWQLAALFVRLFRALDSIVGGRDDAARAWFHSGNSDLDGVPAELVTDVQGLVHVVQYLDAARGRI